MKSTKQHNFIEDYLPYNSIAGIDEAGRGPLAGPVVAACVVLPKDFYHPLIKDSKKLSSTNRIEAYNIILDNALAIGIAQSSNNVIDNVNILNATKLAMHKALDQIKVPLDLIIIDYVDLDIDNSLRLIKGDSLSINVAAASIVAKVYRDNLMMDLDKKYPEYNFKSNKGYPTKEHLKALEKYGATPFHRLSFNPVSKILNNKK